MQGEVRAYLWGTVVIIGAMVSGLLAIWGAHRMADRSLAYVIEVAVLASWLLLLKKLSPLREMALRNKCSPHP